MPWRVSISPRQVASSLRAITLACDAIDGRDPFHDENPAAERSPSDSPLEDGAKKKLPSSGAEGKSFGDVVLTQGGLSSVRILWIPLERAGHAPFQRFLTTQHAGVALLTAKRWLAKSCLFSVRLTWAARCLRFTAASLAGILGRPAWPATLGEQEGFKADSVPIRHQRIQKGKIFFFWLDFRAKK